MKELKFPEESIIKWCEDYYLVERNIDDYYGHVRDTSGQLLGFYFTYAGEESVLITDENIIKQVNDWINEALVKRERKYNQIILKGEYNNEK